MKNFLLFGLCLCLTGVLTATAQTTPKLALAGVEATPTLAKKTASPAASGPAQLAPQTQGIDVMGAWSGNFPSRVPQHVTLTIFKWQDGSAHAEWHSDNLQAQFEVTSVMGSALNGTGNHLRLTLTNSRNRNFNFVLMGDVDPTATTMKAQWTIVGHKVSFPLALFHSGTGSSLASSPVSVATVSATAVDDLAHSINVQMFDRFSSEHLCGIVSDSDLKQAIPPASKDSSQSYDLNNPSTAALFKQAGINYLLVTTLEDYQDQTLEMQRAQDRHYQTEVYNQTRRPGAFASAGSQTQGGFDPEVWQRQIITLNVRCQLFNAATGELLKSASSSFPSHRDYVAVAQGKNELSTADLLAAAAQKVSDWAAILVDDTVFPIEVLAKHDDLVTISRGMESGLKEGQIFNVYVAGEELKDPATGQNLGHDLKMVGRVSITELQPKFSKAKILEDNGIVNGATLTRENPI